LRLKYHLGKGALKLHFFGVIAILLSQVAICHSQPTDFWNVDFAKADSIAFRYEGYSLKKTEQLVDSLTNPLGTDVEKFRAIFRWIADNISYDYQLYLKIISKEAKWKNNKKAMSRLAERMSEKKLRRMILSRKAICSGYATLLDYMCSLAGIESVFINGHGRTYNLSNGRPNHAWNAVKLNGKWYLCDVTWASGWVDSDVQRFFKQFESAYFLTEPSLFICNHYPVEKRWSLLKDPPSLKDFYGSTFKGIGYIENKVNSYSPSNDLLRIKLNDQFQLKFTSNAEKIDDEVSVVVSNQRDNKERLNEKVKLKKNNVGEYVLEFPLTQKGSFYVRIYINHIDTFVYQVVVI
jgi:hypothetical protein